MKPTSDYYCLNYGTYFSTSYRYGKECLCWHFFVQIFLIFWIITLVLLEERKNISNFITKHKTHFVQRMGPQHVSPTCLPLTTIKTTGHHALVIAFDNTVMQQGTCDYLFEAWKSRSRQTRFFRQFRTFHHDHVRPMYSTNPAIAYTLTT